MKLITLFVLSTALALAQPRPLDNTASRQYQHEIKPLRLALDRWLHELSLRPGLCTHLFPLPTVARLK